MKDIIERKKEKKMNLPVSNVGSRDYAVDIGLNAFVV
jgi:hypothetical protein